MQADRVDPGRDAVAGGGQDAARRDHVDHAPGGGLGVVDQRPGQPPVHQRGIGVIGAVGVNLVGIGAFEVQRGGFHRGGGQHEDGQVRVDVERGLKRGAGHHLVLGGHVRQRAVELHMGQPPARRAGHPGRRGDLIADAVLQAFQRHLDAAAAEADQVGEARMGADRHAAVDRQRHGAGHHVRIAGMEAAGDAGRGDQTQKLRIGAHLPGTEAFAHVGVQVDAVGHGIVRRLPVGIV